MKMTRPTLDELALKYPPDDQCDKASHHHNYLRWYERHLARFVGQRPTILEIGIAEGRSLRLWREYFGLDARIIGGDNHRGQCNDARLNGYETFCVDQNSTQDLSMLASICSYDIVIDDGSHHAPHVAATFEVLWPAVKEGGIYVIEDLHHSCYHERDQGHGGARPLLHRLIDHVHNNGRSLVADVRNDSNFSWSPHNTIEPSLIAAHFYPSIVFLEKALKK